MASRRSNSEEGLAVVGADGVSRFLAGSPASGSGALAVKSSGFAAISSVTELDEKGPGETIAVLRVSVDARP
jgi:hypothetical protein